MPYRSAFISGMRKLNTSNFDDLVAFHANKNRTYTQLKSGKLVTSIIEVTLSNVQLFRESMNIGSRIQAEPSDRFLPFGFVLPHSSQYIFCGYTPDEKSFIQATGGNWDVYFETELDYVCSAFDKSYFVENYQMLIGKEVPCEYFQSKISQTTSVLGLKYAVVINQMLQFISNTPSILNNEKLNRLFCSEILNLTIKALSPSLEKPLQLKPNSKRKIKIDNVIDYIFSNAESLPDIQTLCKIAQLSERSLQYGFVERVGMTPIQYLRIIRLNKARLDLMKSKKAEVNVSDIALKWGFVEFGRFAQDYKKIFHELPSYTLSIN